MTETTRTERPRLFCVRCNPQQLHPTDRRATERGGHVMAFSRREARERRDMRLDRRGRHDRRVAASQHPESQHPNERERRKIDGRRAFDGYAWFEGCLEEAVQENWRLAEEDPGPSLPRAQPRLVVCPKCVDSSDSSGG